VVILRRLLLIDAVEDARTVIRASLERRDNWIVIPVASGEAALDVAVVAGPFDAVLLAATMPGMGGPSTLEGMRDCGLPADVPIIFLTGEAQAVERQALMFLGAAGVIAKPVDPVSLPREVASLLNHSR
jgi:two-component system, OmpR family, response regulator